MIAVVAQHSLSGLRAGGGGFWLLQAVPVLLILQGMNSAGSFARRESVSRAWFVQQYVPKVFKRLFVPFACAWVISLIIAVSLGRFHPGPSMLVGVLPLPGPGNYFVPIAFVLTLTFPLLWAQFTKRPAAVVLVLWAVDIAFELISPHVGPLGTTDVLYEFNPLRYLAAFATGMLLAQRARNKALLSIILAMTPLSLVFLLADKADSQWLSMLNGGFPRTTSVFAIPYVAALTIAALGLLRPVQLKSFAFLRRVVTEIGQSTFSIFLAQLLWFAAMPSGQLESFPVACISSFVIGVAFSLALRAVIASTSANLAPWSGWRVTGA